MPYKDPEDRKRFERDYKRRKRAEKRAEAKANAPKLRVVESGPVGDVVAEWARDELKVPTGLLAGKPFIVDDWQRDWLNAAMSPGIAEAGLSVARKNGKSGLIAALLLACLVGPLNRKNWRAAVVSVTGILAKELQTACIQIAAASEIGEERLVHRVTPAPGRLLGLNGATVDFLAADKSTGHAIGVDLAVVDEAGLLPERDRGLWDAVYSSMSGRNGRLLAISILGDGPMFAELRDRAGESNVHWVHYGAHEEAALDDEGAWHAANPGLVSGIKSIDYMRNAALRAAANPASAPGFRAYDLNLPQDPAREMILTPAQWLDCCPEEMPPRGGDCVVGIDAGGSSSMTAAVAYWPETNRFEARGAFPATPDLAARGQADGVGGLYSRMRQRGEITVYPGRVTDLVQFLDDVASWLDGEHVVVCGADRYRREEIRTGMEAAALSWPMVWRGQGASATADGSADVRHFQKAALGGRVACERSLLMESAIASSSLARDTSGNPKLDKSRALGRIDALQAAVIAVGLGERLRAKPRRSVYIGAV